MLLDEANIHVPQTKLARAECETFMNAANRIVTGQRNAPICGVVQDGLVVAHLLTRRGLAGAYIPLEAFYDALVAADVEYDPLEFLARAYKYYPDDISYDVATGEHAAKSGRIPGKLVLSAILPPDLHYRRRTGTDPERPEVLIQEGVVLATSGPLCKRILGAKENSIVHVLWLEYSPKAALDFISHVQIMTDILSPRFGFSMGLGDCYTHNRDEVAKLLAEMDARYSALDPAQESRRNAELNSAMSSAPAIVSRNLYGGVCNAAVVMGASGAKGQAVNRTQIAAFIGQQNVGGRRPPRQLADGTRTLPAFARGDTTPASQGFIYGSYLSGQQPHEAFFSAMSGRSGIVDTACKTSGTGYIQKKIAQKVADLQVRSDGSVRDAQDRIVQYLYGGDGLDPQRLATLRTPGARGYGLAFPFFVDPAALAERLTPVGAPGSGGETVLLAREMRAEMYGVMAVGAPGAPPGRHATRNLHTILTGLLRTVRVPRAQAPAFCRGIVDAFHRARVAPGEMVGQNLTTAIGEITTQLVLSFFHFAGLSLKDASLGVPRFEELLNIAKKPDKVTCTVYPDPAAPAGAVGAPRGPAGRRAAALRVVREMLADRGYAEGALEPALAGAPADTVRFARPAPKPRELFIFFAETPKIGIRHIQAYAAFLQRRLDGARAAAAGRPHSKPAAACLLVVENPVSPKARDAIKNYRAQNILFDVFLLDELQYNVTRHVLVPRHRVCAPAELDKLLKNFGVAPKDKFDRLKLIERSDPVVRYYGASRGTLIEIKRPMHTMPGYYELDYRLVT